MDEHGKRSQISLRNTESTASGLRTQDRHFGVSKVTFYTEPG